MAFTVPEPMTHSIFALLKEIIEESTVSTTVQQNTLCPINAGRVSQIRCCGTVFTRPHDLSEHAKIHLWKNEMTEREFWAAKAGGVCGKMEFEKSCLEYRELRRSEFRVLNAVYPNEESDVLRFRMAHTSLERPLRPYVALSYCWGQDCRTTIVQIDDGYVEVSENVEHALKQLLARGHRTIYVDRICINQHDVKEKGSQILMMGQIFRNAGEVSIWLGDDYNGSDKVMDLIRYWKSPDGSPESFRDEALQQQLRHTPPTAAEVDHFFSRQYWSRSWIIQECVVAKQLKIYCGNKEIGWNYVARFIENCYQLERRSPGVPIKPANFDVVHRLVQSRKSRLDGGPVSLLQALQYHRHSLVSMGHDKVFALLGLAHDREQYVTAPQYSCSLRSMCLELTTSFVESSGDTALDIIFAAQRTSSPLWLPSWCPDYLHVRTQPFSNRILTYLARQDVKFRLGKRCEKWDATMSCNSIIEDNDDHQDQRLIFQGNSLFVRGVFVGRITNVNVPNPFSKPPNAAGYVPRQPQVKDSAIFDQLSRLLMLFHPNYEKWSSHPEALKYLFGDTTWRMLNHSCEVSRDWLRSMRDFKVFGQSVKVRATSSAMHRWKNALQSVAGSRHEAVWATDHRSMMTAVNDLRDDKLVLMTTDMGGVGWVEDAARIGDEVFLLQGCSLPVILRRQNPMETAGVQKQRRSKKYAVVGYSIVDGWMDNKRWNLARQSRYGKTPSFDSDTEWSWRWQQRQANRYCLENLEIV